MNKPVFTKQFKFRGNRVSYQGEAERMGRKPTLEIHEQRSNNLAKNTHQTET